MTYCNSSSKATVTYKLGSNPQKTYVTDKTPISVDVSQKYQPSFTGGQCCDNQYNVFGFSKFVGNSTNEIEKSFVTNALGKVAGIRKTPHPSIPNRHAYELIMIRCDNTEQLTALLEVNDSAFTDIFISRVVAVSGLNNCGDPKPICTIKVLHKNQVIFTDSGDCPISFKVTCGENCPDGTIKCFKSGYPGFCCVPCGEIKTGIKAITNHVRSLNNG